MMIPQSEEAAPDQSANSSEAGAPQLPKSPVEFKPIYDIGPLWQILPRLFPQVGPIVPNMDQAEPEPQHVSRAPQ